MIEKSNKWVAAALRDCVRSHGFILSEQLMKMLSAEKLDLRTEKWFCSGSLLVSGRAKPTGCLERGQRSIKLSKMSKLLVPLVRRQVIKEGHWESHWGKKELKRPLICL